MEETGFFTRLMLNPKDGTVLETAAHVGFVGIVSMLSYEWLGLREKVYVPLTRSLGGSPERRVPVSRRISAPAPRGGM